MIQQVFYSWNDWVYCHKITNKNCLEANLSLLQNPGKADGQKKVESQLHPYVFLRYKPTNSWCSEGRHSNKGGAQTPH